MIFSQDVGKVFQRYDEAVDDYLTVKLFNSGFGDLSRSDINSMSITDIQEACKARGRTVDDIADRGALTTILLNTQRVPVTFSGPAVNASNQRLITGKSAAQHDVAGFYPIIIVTRTGVTPDSAREQSSIPKKVSYASNGDQVLMSSHPAAVRILYTVEVISLYHSEINSIDGFFLRFGSRDAYRKIDIGFPWGERQVAIGLSSGYADESELEAPTSKAVKRLRHIYPMEIDGWVPNDVFIARTIRTVSADFSRFETVVISSDGRETEELGNQRIIFVGGSARRGVGF